jgi:hypothetical protein
VFPVKKSDIACISEAFSEIPVIDPMLVIAAVIPLAELLLILEPVVP